MKRFTQPICSGFRAWFVAFSVRSRISLLYGLCAVTAVCWLVGAADHQPDSSAIESKPASEDLKALRKENEQLKIENSLLRRENQQLRRLLMENAGSPTTAATLANLATTNQLAPRSEPGFTHWLSNSGKRHNPKCRYFQNGTGRPCAPDEGTACKVCGG